MFYKARIGSRMPGTKIKRCWNWACTLMRPPVRLSVQGPVATSGYTLGARLSVQSAVLHSNFRALPLFHPKSPILISQHPNMFPKIVTGSWTQKGFQKHIKHKIKCYFNTIHQFNPFLQNPQQQLNSYHKSEIMNTQGYHQQQYLITTTTSIKHDFINNPSTTIHSSSFMGKIQH